MSRKPMFTNSQLAEDWIMSVLERERGPMERHVLYLYVCDAMKTSVTGVGINYSIFIETLDRLVKEGKLYSVGKEYWTKPFG